MNFLDPLGLSDQAVCGPADPSDPPAVSSPGGTDTASPPEGTQPLGYMSAGASWFDSRSAKQVKLLTDLIKSLLGKPIQKPPPPPPPQIIRQIPKVGGPGGGMMIIMIDPQLIMRLVDPCGTLFHRNTPVPASCLQA